MTEPSLKRTVMTVPAATSVPAATLWEIAWTLPEEDAVPPVTCHMSPAEVRRWLASAAVSPTTLGTATGVSGVSSPR